MKFTISLPIALAVLFIGLKLARVIDWNWFWVLSPLWGPVCLVGAILTLTVTVWFTAIAAVAAGLGVITYFENRNRRKL